MLSGAIWAAVRSRFKRLFEIAFRQGPGRCFAAYAAEDAQRSTLIVGFIDGECDLEIFHNRWEQRKCPPRPAKLTDAAKIECEPIVALYPFRLFRGTEAGRNGVPFHTTPAAHALVPTLQGQRGAGSAWPILYLGCLPSGQALFQAGHNLVVCPEWAEKFLGMHPVPVESTIR